MGLATGCIGMNLTDFYGCTPFEFGEIYKAWQERCEHTDRQSWEQTRWTAMCSLQPYCKNGLTAHQLLPLPWDEIQDEERPEEKGLSSAELMEKWYKDAREVDLDNK